MEILPQDGLTFIRLSEIDGENQNNKVSMRNQTYISPKTAVLLSDD